MQTKNSSGVFDREFFRRNIGLFQTLNEKMLRIAYPATGAAVFLAAVLMGVADASFQSVGFLWIGVALYSVGTLLVYLLLPEKKRFASAAWSGYFCISALLAISVDAVMTPAQPAKIIYLVLIAAPLLYSGYPVLPCSLIACGAAISCVAAAIFKHDFPTVLRTDVVGVVCSGGLGIAFSFLRSRTSTQMAHVLYGMEKAENAQRSDALIWGEAERRCRLFFSARMNQQQCALFLMRIQAYETLCALLGEAQAKQTVDLIGKRITMIFREGDIVGFRSDATFLILMKDVRNADAVEKKSAELHRLIGEIFAENRELSLDANIGAVYISNIPITFEDALEQAQKALLCSLGACDAEFVIVEA